MAKAEDYEATLAGARITLGVQQRRDAIWADVTAAAKAAGGGSWGGVVEGVAGAEDGCSWCKARMVPKAAMVKLWPGPLTIHIIPSIICCSKTGVVPKASTVELLAEVSNLVESPTVVAGSFDPKFLELPKWVVRLHACMGACMLAWAVACLHGAQASWSCLHCKALHCCVLWFK